MFEECHKSWPLILHHILTCFLNSKRRCCSLWTLSSSFLFKCMPNCCSRACRNRKSSALGNALQIYCVVIVHVCVSPQYKFHLTSVAAKHSSHPLAWKTRPRSATPTEIRAKVSFSMPLPRLWVLNVSHWFPSKHRVIHRSSDESGWRWRFKMGLSLHYEHLPYGKKKNILTTVISSSSLQTAFSQHGLQPDHLSTVEFCLNLQSWLPACQVYTSSQLNAPVSHHPLQHIILSSSDSFQTEYQ